MPVPPPSGRALGTVTPSPPAPGGEGGIPALDRARLHEVHAGGVDRAGALAFALAGVRGREADGPALFLVRLHGGKRARAGLHGEGLARLGLDPAGLTIVEATDETALLRAALDAARCPALAGVVIESEGRLAAYDLTASRRLALAAERSGGRIAMIRIDAEPRPSAAFTRWTIASAPSAPLPGAAPGRPMLLARLDRRRGWAGGPGRWLLEWDSNDGSFRPLPQPAPAPAADIPRPVAALAPLRGRAA